MQGARQAKGSTTEMNTIRLAQLVDRSLIEIRGKDAEHFLQGLLTKDVEKLNPGGSCFAGLLTAQGKILFEFFVVRTAEGFLLDTASEQKADLIKRLEFYKLRANVIIDDRSIDLAVYAAWNGDSDLGDITGLEAKFVDPRFGAMGQRIIATKALGVNGANITPASGDDYHSHRIAIGVPAAVHDYTLGDTFPHEAGWDQLNGVDFAKGCFVGQEVVSRMQHRGTARKRAVPVQAASALPPRNTEITADEVPVGKLGSSHGNNGIAMLRLDRVQNAYQAGAELVANGITLWPRKPAWAEFQLPLPNAENDP